MVWTSFEFGGCKNVLQILCSTVCWNDGFGRKNFPYYLVDTILANTKFQKVIVVTVPDKFVPSVENIG